MSKNKKSVIRLIVVTIICAIGGGIVGYLSASKQHTLSQMLNEIGSYGMEFIVGLAALMIALFVISILFYLKGKKIISLLNDDDEENYDKADKLLCNSLIIVQINNIIGMIIIGVLPAITFNQKDLNALYFIFLIIAIFIIIQIFSQYLVVKIIKKSQILSPEKKGFALDKNFEKEWMNSCDEAEKSRIGEASYFAYKNITKAFPFAILVCMILGIILDIGPVPVIVVVCLWLVSAISYSYKSIELERKSRGQK